MYENFKLSCMNLVFVGCFLQGVLSEDEMRELEGEFMAFVRREVHVVRGLHEAHGELLHHQHHAAIEVIIYCFPLCPFLFSSFQHYHLLFPNSSPVCTSHADVT
jgi:hypothetical protein